MFGILFSSVVSSALASAPLTPGLVKAIVEQDPAFKGAKIEICYTEDKKSCETIDRTDPHLTKKQLVERSRKAQKLEDELAKPVHKIAVHYVKTKYFGLVHSSVGFSHTGRAGMNEAIQHTLDLGGTSRE